jgi:hypothetical protein
VKTALSVLMLGASLLAQQTPANETKTPRPPVTGELSKSATMPAAKTPDAPATQDRCTIPQKPRSAATEVGMAAIHAAMSAPDFLVIDTPHDGEHWARGANWKAGFTASGIEFFAAPADRSQAAPRANLLLQHVSAGGKALAVKTATPRLEGNHVSWQHGDLVESVDIHPQGIEQTFTFASLPNRGELVLSLSADSLQSEDLGDGVALAGGAIRYSEAIAIDANGNRTAAATQFENGGVTIRVPASFLVNAALPLVIDPWVSTTLVSSGTVELSNPDTVWDTQDSTWMVAFDSRFALNDTDVFAQRLSSSYQPVGSMITIDATSFVWQMPAIANLQLHHRNLVVAQVSADDIAPFWIGGRLVETTGVLATTQIDIEKAGNTSNASGDKLHPDVGGDPSPAGPTYFTVVWERAFSPTDHDIHMKQVAWDGTLRNAAPTVITNGLDNASWPSISKSDGASPNGNGTAFQQWAVVWQRTFSPTDEDIYGALITWDGNFVPVNATDTFPITTSTANDTRPSVSSPTQNLGVRNYVVATSRTSAQNGHVYALAFNSAGTVIAASDVSAASLETPSTWPQGNPSVDCDGVRFAIAYESTYGGSGSDIDIRTMLVSATPGNLQIRDEAWVAAGSVPEFACEITSLYSSTGIHNLGYLITNEMSTSPNYVIQAHHYAGFGVGSFSTRTTGCGSLAITPTGTVGLGETVHFALNTNYPVSGFVVGFPQSQQTPACPGCILGVNGIAVMANPYSLQLPAHAAYVGVTLSAQGFTFASGPCLGSVSISDTVDFTLL